MTEFRKDLHPRDRLGRWRLTPGQREAILDLEKRHGGVAEAYKGIGRNVVTRHADGSLHTVSGFGTHEEITHLPPSGDRIALAPAEPVNHAGFVAGDRVLIKRHFTDHGQRFIAGQTHRVTQVIGGNQVAIEHPNGERGAEHVLWTGETMKDNIARALPEHPRSPGRPTRFVPAGSSPTQRFDRTDVLGPGGEVVGYVGHLPDGSHVAWAGDTRLGAHTDAADAIRAVQTRAGVRPGAAQSPGRPDDSATAVWDRVAKKVAEQASGLYTNAITYELPGGKRWRVWSGGRAVAKRVNDDGSTDESTRMTDTYPYHLFPRILDAEGITYDRARLERGYAKAYDAQARDEARRSAVVSRARRENREFGTDPSWFGLDENFKHQNSPGRPVSATGRRLDAREHEAYFGYQTPAGRQTLDHIWRADPEASVGQYHGGLTVMHTRVGDVDVDDHGDTWPPGVLAALTPTASSPGRPGPYDPSPSPAPSLRDGQRVTVARDIGDYDGFGYRAAGAKGTVVGYATPELKKNQRWRDESYFVRLDGDTGGGRRVLNRADLRDETLPPHGPPLPGPGSQNARSPGRPIDRSLSRHERVLAAQRGPKPEPVGDIFTALNAAIAQVHERKQRTAQSPGRPGATVHNASDWGSWEGAQRDEREARVALASAQFEGDARAVTAAQARLQAARDRLVGAGGRIDKSLHRNALAASVAAMTPGRPVREPEGGISIVSAGRVSGPFSTWDQAAWALAQAYRTGGPEQHAEAHAHNARDRGHRALDAQEQAELVRRTTALLS